MSENLKQNKPKAWRKNLFLGLSIIFFYILISLNPIIYKNKILCMSEDMTIMNSNIDLYKVKVLCSKEQITQGYQKSIEPDIKSGKFFVLGLPGKQGFWMKDVSFDLAIIFLDAKYRVLASTKLKANSEEIVWSPDNTAYAIELKAGQENNFKIGEQLTIN